MKFDDSYEARGKISHTAREALLSKRGVTTAYETVKRFLKALEPDFQRVLQSETIAQKLEVEIRGLDNESISVPLYRVRAPATAADIKDHTDMGPPPDPALQEGYRYALQEETVLFVSESPVTAWIETGAPDAREGPVKLQEFQTENVELSTISISTELHELAPLLHALHFICERPVDDLDKETQLRATHFIAWLCRKHEVESIRYPAVGGRYAENEDAWNLAVFPEGWNKMRRVEQPLPLDVVCSGKA